MLDNITADFVNRHSKYKITNLKSWELLPGSENCFRTSVWIENQDPEITTFFLKNHKSTTKWNNILYLQMIQSENQYCCCNYIFALKYKL
mgnify:FL=1